jgi:PAS domain S-box-containing protein
MHPWVLVPLLSVVVAAILASVVAARERDRRAGRLGSLVLVAAGVWSLFELLSVTAPNAERAALLLRWSTLGSLSVGPLILHLIIARLDSPLGRLRHLLPASYAAGALGILVSVATHATTTGARPAPWGWVAVPGPALPAVYGLVTAPLVLLVFGLRRAGSGLQLRVNGAEIAGLIFMCVASLTDFVLPFSGIACPRLGAPMLVLWGVVSWWTVYRFDEAALSPQKFAREILDTLPDGVALLRRDGRVRTANKRLAKLTGQPLRDLLGTSAADLLVGGRGQLEHGGGEIECDLVTAAGLRVPVSISYSPLEHASDEPAGHVLVVRDVREVVALRNRLAASGRLVAVGQLAAGIAHEINNPISYVRSNLGLLKGHWEKLRSALEGTRRGPGASNALEGGLELLHEAGAEIDRVADIVRDVGGLSHGGSLETEAVDLSELLDAAVRVATTQLQPARIERDYGDVPLVPCTPQEMLQVLLNLLLNARQSFHGEGTIRLTTRRQSDAAVIEIADDGRGIDPDTLERIFEPFFTAERCSEGAGLGLSISQQIVTKHGGTIRAESEPGRGTTFRIRLPVNPRRSAGDEQESG